MQCASAKEVVGLSSVLFMYQVWTLYHAGHLSEILVLPICMDNHVLLAHMTGIMLSGYGATC